MGHAWRVGSVWCNQRIYIGLLLFSTITWMFMSFYRFNKTTLPTFFEENKKCLETRTDGLIAEQLWLSFHTIVNECSSKNYLVYRRHPNEELDVDHVVANAENWDCTIASYGLSQSSSVEVELAEEAPYCQIYGIGSDKRNEDKFTKIGEYFEAKDLLKDHDGVVEGDRERSERRKRETNYSDSDHAEVKKKEKSVEKVEKVKERRTEKGMYVLENPFEKDKISMREVVSTLIKQEVEHQRKLKDNEKSKKKKQNKTNSKLPTTKKETSKLDNSDKKDNGEKREREVNKLQKNEGGHQTQAHPPKRNSLLPQASENDENLGKDDKEGSHVNNATINWHAELKEEPVGKKTERKLPKKKADKEEEAGPDEVPEEEEKAFKRKLKKEKQARKERKDAQDKHDESQGSAPNRDIDGDVRTKFARERGDIEEGTEVEQLDPESKIEEEKVDKRAGYLIEHNAGPDNDENGEYRGRDRKKVEHLLEQKRGSALKRIGDLEKTTEKPSTEIADDDVSETFTTSGPSTAEPGKSTTKQPDPEDDVYTTAQNDADKETLRELGDEKAMIEDDKDYVMPSTVAIDSDNQSTLPGAGARLEDQPEHPSERKTTRKFLNVDIETYLLKNIKRKMIYQLSINVINGFETLSALTSSSLKSIDICQINVILPKPSKKNLEQFAAFYKYSMRSMGLLPLVVDLIDKDTRIYFINTTSPACLNLFLFSSGKLGG